MFGFGKKKDESMERLIKIGGHACLAAKREKSMCSSVSEAFAEFGDMTKKEVMNWKNNFIAERTAQARSKEH